MDPDTRRRSVVHRWGIVPRVNRSIVANRGRVVVPVVMVAMMMVAMVMVTVMPMVPVVAALGHRRASG